MRMALATSMFIAAMLNPVILVDTAKATFANIVSLGIALMPE